LFDFNTDELVLKFCFFFFFYYYYVIISIIIILNISLLPTSLAL